MGTLELNVVATLYRALSSSYSCLLRAEPSLSSAPFGMEFLSPAADDGDEGLKATLFLQQHPIRPRSVRTTSTLAILSFVASPLKSSVRLTLTLDGR